MFFRAVSAHDAFSLVFSSEFVRWSVRSTRLDAAPPGAERALGKPGGNERRHRGLTANRNSLAQQVRRPVFRWPCARKRGSADARRVPPGLPNARVAATRRAVLIARVVVCFAPQVHVAALPHGSFYGSDRTRSFLCACTPTHPFVVTSALRAAALPAWRPADTEVFLRPSHQNVPFQSK